MAQAELVAAIRAYKRAEERLEQARADRDEAIRQAIRSGEWKIADVVEVAKLSRETIRKIANPAG
jgi:anti-sigma28 factor (negative regulator of flagellin synthesis)